ncbi:DUF4383 domain-containing protein [Kineococcus sp. SYSU DK004]|uniref:DUF4383 domain-containing protein n=1 Tax=Kineococcus sp. SYSU DK004 TaxID=3383125 RepID=UPI003D7C8FAE
MSTAEPMSTPALEGTQTRKLGPVQRNALVTGGVLALLGLLGFVPGLVADYDQYGFFRSGGQLFGIFTVSVVSSFLLLLFGGTIIAFVDSVKHSHKNVVFHAWFLIAMGVAGAGIVSDSPAELLPTNAASNWLYLGLGVVFLVAGRRARVRQVREHGIF